jgi:hypothetical protein
MGGIYDSNQFQKPKQNDNFIDIHNVKPIIKISDNNNNFNPDYNPNVNINPFNSDKNQNSKNNYDEMDVVDVKEEKLKFDFNKMSSNPYAEHFQVQEVNL